MSWEKQSMNVIPNQVQKLFSHLTLEELFEKSYTGTKVELFGFK